MSRRPKHCKFISYLAIVIGGFILAMVIKVALTVILLPDLDWYVDNDPTSTAMMRFNGDGDTTHIDWVPLSEISPNLVRAVLLSEDVTFFKHKGVDWDEFKASVKQNLKRKEFYRGGSTITMQVARNLFLSPGKNPLRKVEEMIIARKLERHLTKRRILEIYLNIAEWGHGIYGIESAAEYHFSVPARQLTVEQSCALAAILPSPRKWSPKEPSDYVQSRILRLHNMFYSFPLKIPGGFTEEDSLDFNQ
ncbi:monofunctional biosynthetic peptidoglycan transglycosylase [bacterium]|nr:monofunctional biosynthetic peptidoglycan transglycosylase [bacterium]